jgi:hypothetical protein
MDNNIK